MTVHYQDDRVTLHTGKALEVAPALPDQSVDCIVTSPPYFGLRDYGVEGQAGTEETPAEYVAHLTELFRELRRVLTDDGTLWLNLGDSYSSGNSGQSGMTKLGERWAGGGQRADASKNGRPRTPGARPKSLLLVPARTVIALQDDGWILRNDVIWHKTNAMPESVRDRLNARHEHIYLLTKSPRYWFDLDPIRTEHSPESIARANRSRITAYTPGGQIPNKRKETQPNPKGKNPGDVWAIGTSQFRGAHFATFPPDIPRRAILAGCKPGGTVLDPFSGAATTGMVALQLGRKYVGIDIKADYHDLALSTRLHQTGLL